MKTKTIDLGYIHMSSYKHNSDLVEIHDDEPKYMEEQRIHKAACNPDEIILPANQEYSFTLTYPLNNPFVTKLNTTKNGLTRRQIVEFIIKSYKKVYSEEDKSSKIKAKFGKNSYNRIETNGKYGIWGHVMSDLVLHSLEIDDENKSLTTHPDS